jgi:hypothetical protein
MMSFVKIFKSREEYFNWLKYKDDKIKITSVVNTVGDDVEDSLEEADDIYTVTAEGRPAFEHA